jgi:SAM-dependent methyltransferase
MTHADLNWFDRCRRSGLVGPTFLEIGSAKVQHTANLCDRVRTEATTAIGTDLNMMDGVDLIADFALPSAQFTASWTLGQFDTVAIFNVLEHTFDPVTVLGNALGCVKPAGTLLVLTPAIWPVHKYPNDYVRLLPDWYTTFSRMNNLTIVADLFCWVSQFGIQPIPESESFPNYLSVRQASRYKYWKSRLVHRLANTYGRTHWATHCAVAAAMCKKPNS